MEKFFRLPSLPYPVSVNDLYRPINRGNYAQIILSSEGRRYKQEISTRLLDAGIAGPLRDYIEYHETIDVYVYAYKPNWKTLKGTPNRNAGDLSNLRKILEDVIFNMIGIDDCCIFGIIDRKLNGPEPRVDVVITAEQQMADLF